MLLSGADLCCWELSWLSWCWLFSLSLLAFSFSSTDVFSWLRASSGDFFASPVLRLRGLCHLRWDARLAGQLKTLSHSGQRYSTRTILEHLCWARENGSVYSSLQSWQMNSPSGFFLPLCCASFDSGISFFILSPRTGEVVTSSSKLSFLMTLGFFGWFAFALWVHERAFYALVEGRVGGHRWGHRCAKLHVRVVH